MYNVSQNYHNLIANGAEQNLLIVFNDLYLSGLDHDFEVSGAELQEYFNTSTDIEIGEVSSSVFGCSVLNLDGSLNTFKWGEGKPYIGVKTGTGTYTRPSGATAFTVFVDINGETHNVVGYDNKLVIDGADFSTDNQPVNIIWAREELYVQTPETMYEYQYDVTTDEWTVSTDATNPHMAAKEAEGVAFYDNVLTRYLEDSTTETWEYCPLGIFNFETPAKRQVPVIGVTAYDRMTMFDKDADDFLSRTWEFPITLQYFYEQLCEYVGVPYSTESTAFEAVYYPETKTLGLSGLTHGYASNVLTLSGINHSYANRRLTLNGIEQSFTNADMSFTAIPSFGTNTTCRDVLSYIAEASGSVARFDRDGVLSLRWYGTLPVTILTENDIALNAYDKAEYATPIVDQITSKLANGEVYTEGSGQNVYTILANSLLASDSTRYAVILDKLQSIGVYVPIIGSVINADPSIESGDRVILLGGNIPLMSQIITWKGYTAAQYIATGLSKRELPSSMDRYGFAVAYNAAQGADNASQVKELHYALYADGTGLTQIVSDHDEQLSAVQTDVGDLNSALNDYITGSEDAIEGARATSQHIRYGVVGYDENDDPIAGVAVGKNVEVTQIGVEDVVTINNLGVFTASDITFYVNSENVAQFGARGQSLGNKWAWYIEGDDSMSLKWIG